MKRCKKCKAIIEDRFTLCYYCYREENPDHSQSGKGLPTKIQAGQFMRQNKIDSW